MRTVLRLLWMSLVLVIVALTSALVAMRLAIHGREVAVPDLKGKTPAEARRAADDSGLGVLIEREYYSATIPAGRVMSQAPPAGSVVRRGWEIRAAVSAGAQRAAVPQVVGESERAAAIAIAQRGLQLGLPAAVVLPGAESGQVLAQNPPANATDATAPNISLLVAAESPAEAYVTPSFIGQPLGSVALALKDAGFTLGRVTAAQTAPATPDSSSPAPSQGPPSNSASPSPSSVPPANAAAPSVPPSPPVAVPFTPSPAAIIVSQEPAPGQKVLAGSAINFVVR